MSEPSMLQTTEACENMTSDLTPKHRLVCSHMLAESPRELHLSEDGRVDPGSCGPAGSCRMCLVDERDFIIRGFWLAGTGASLQRTGFSLEAAALDQPQPWVLFVCMCHVCAWCSQRPKEGARFPWT